MSAFSRSRHISLTALVFAALRQLRGAPGNVPSTGQLTGWTRWAALGVLAFAGQAHAVDSAIAGFQAPSENGCIWVAAQLGGFDCNYTDVGGVWDTVPINGWSGPIFNGGYYSPGSAEASPTYVPVPGDAKIPPAITGVLSISGSGPTAVISGTLIVGPAARNIFTGNVTRGVESWTSITHTLPPTPVSSAMDLGGGNFLYVIGSLGPPDDLCLTVGTDCFPAETGSSTIDGPAGFWNDGVAPGIGITRNPLLDGNVGATTTAVMAGYANSCTNSADCATGFIIWGATGPTAEDPGWDNLILEIETDAAGKVVFGIGWWTQEFRISFGPAPPPGDNSWTASQIFFGNGTPAANDFAVTVPRNSSNNILDTPANIFNFIEPTVTITSGPDHGAATVNLDNTISYTPTVGYTGPDSIVYLVTDEPFSPPDSGTITITVQDTDQTPDPFSFTDVTDVPVSTLQTSNIIFATGINTTVPISVVGGVYSINGGPFTAAAGTVSQGVQVRVQHTSSAAFSTAVNTTLTIGSVSDAYTSTTVAGGGGGGDPTPDPFVFTEQTNVALSTVITSDTVTIAGIDTAAPISVTGGQYSIGCTATFTPASATITNGQTVCVRHTSSANNGVNVDTVLTVGGVSDTFRSTTASDTTPDPFSFNDQIQQPLATLVTSNTVTISGIDGPAAIAVIGGEYAIGCTTFTSAPGTITNGQTVCVRHITAATNGGRVNTQLTVGGVAGIFFTTTVLADPVVVADTPPSPTPAVDPPVILFDKTAAATAATIQDIGIETDGLVTGGTAVIGFCTAIDPRETEGPGATYNPRPLPLSELAGTCSSLAGESLVVPAYMRPIPDALGVRRFVFSTANTTVELEGVAVSQGYGEDIVTYLGNVSPPCNVPLSSRPLWLWGVRAGEEVDGVLTNENQVMKPTSIQCNAARSATRRFSNFIQNVSLDETLYSSASYLAGQSKDLDTVLNKLDADDNSCSATLQSLTTAMRTQAAICRTATVFAVVTRDTSVAPVRINRTVYQYAMKVKLRNYGGPVTSAQAVIRSGVPSTVVTGGVVTKLFPGGIGAGVGGGYAETAAQSFTIQQDRLLPVNVGVLLPAVSFVPDLVGANANRYPDAVAGCEQLARLAKQNRPAFDSCPANIRAKKYRGALIGGGLGAAFTTYDRLARPVSGGTWSIYPLPTDIIEPGQIPPGP